MISRILLGAFAAAFLSAVTLEPAVVLAAAAKKEETKKDETKKETKKKALSPQNQKMKDCSAKWGEEKKAKKVSGKKAHQEFMSGCLKG
jgi:hypothetical protein